MVDMQDLAEPDVLRLPEMSFCEGFRCSNQVVDQPWGNLPVGLHRLLYSNSRSLECHSSWFAHFDSDSLNRHHPDVEKGLRYGLQGPEPARFWRSPAGFGT